MLRAVRSARPDVVHFASHRDLAAAATVRAAGTPTVVEVDEVLPGRARAWLGALAIRAGADAAIAVSHAVAEPLWDARVDAHVAHPGLAVAERPAGSASTARVVVGAAGVSQRLGTDLFVAAAALLAPALGRIELQLAGPLDATDLEWAQTTVARAQAAGVSYRSDPELGALMHGWDIAVVPSREEGFSEVALTAMALGLPVVATAVGGLPEQVTPATGILVLPGDAGALATAIGEFANYPERRARAGNEGRERVASKFSPEAQAAAVRRAYEAALASRGLTPP
jgi:glycosyltransferase involved in cell wall biosynthesis